jgi:Uma2 family endonuclease
MLATSIGAEQRTILHNISWETFEALLRETGSGRGSRFAYEDGTLEIMTPLFEHENPKINFDRFIFILVEELEIEIKSAGSTTIKKEDLKKGIEPDNCYYIQNELAVRGRETLDFETDPPPDLAIEIDITSSSVNKFSIYSALKVPEIWRYNGSKLKFYELINNKYVERDYSISFPLVSASDINNFIEQSKTKPEIALLKSFRAWVKQKISTN